MGIIRYRKIYFSEPDLISEDVYNQLKKEIDNNPNFEINSSGETFTQHFSSLLQTLLFSFIIGIFCFAVFEDGNPFIAVGGISMFLSFACLVYLFLEGPSYATYLKTKNAYYTRMRNVIKNTSYYWEFLMTFYKS